MATATLASLEALRSELVNSKYYLNVRSGYMAPVTLHCSYGDSGENIMFYIFDGGQAFDLTGSSVSIHGTRRDGASFGPFACHIDGNSVSFELQSSMTAIEGGGLAEFTISKAGTTIGTCNFGILVENATFPNGVAYDTDPSVYQDILKYVQSEISNDRVNYMTLISNEATARINGDASLSDLIAVEKSRIDTIISGGTAPEESELIDIRTKYDTTVATTAGNAVREQVEEVKNMAKGTIPVGSLVADRYVDIAENHYGQFSAYTGWSRTDYIDVRNFDGLLISTNTKSAYNVFYDSSKNPILKKDFIVYIGTTYIEVPSNAAYVILSNLSSAMDTLTIECCHKIPIAGIADNAYIACGPLIADHYVSIIDVNYGQFPAYTGWSRTDYIKISDFKKLRIESQSESTYNVFYDSAKNPILGKDFTIITGITYINIPENATYVIFSGANAMMESLLVQGGIFDDHNGYISIKPLIADHYVSIIDVNYGQFPSESGWSRTDYIKIYGYKQLEAISTVESTYNVFYDSAKNPILGKDFTVGVGITHIEVPDNAYYAVLSNTTASMQTLKLKVGTFENAVSIIENGSELMFKKEIQTTVKTIESHSDSPAFALSLVTDTHFSLRDENIIRRGANTFKNIYSVTKRCWSDGLAILGDLVQADVSDLEKDETDAIIRTIMNWAILCNKNVFAINGNHDGVHGGIPMTNNYSTMFRMNENYVVRENGNPYYYVDYTRYKIRAFYLATNHQLTTHVWGMDNDQLTWFQNTLNSVPNGYDIVIFSHIGIFNTNDFKTNRSQCCDALNNWISNATGKCIGWYCGHEHLDCIVPVSSSGINCPHVALQCASMQNWTPTSSDTYIYNLPWISNPRSDKTIAQDCWTTLVYNRADNKVYLVRFGAGNDMTINLNDY